MKRKDPIERRQQILRKAVEVSCKIGYQKITRDNIATPLKISRSLISHYFNSIHELKQTVLKTAIDQNNSELIAQGLINQEPIIKKWAKKNDRRISLI